MKKGQVILIAFCAVMAAFTVSAQVVTTASLRSSIHSTGSDKERLAQILTLSGMPLNPDTLLPYVYMAEAIAAKTKDRFDASRASSVRAGYYVRKNYVDSALAIVERLIHEYKNNEERKDFYLGLLFFRAKVLDRGNRYTQALTQLYEVVEKAQLLKDTLIEIQAETGIGWVQMEMEQHREALQWLYRAMNVSPDKKFYKNYGALYSNIASAYNALGKTDSAKAYIDIAIKDARANGNHVFLATALSMQAKIFIDSRQPTLAEAPLHEVVDIRKNLNDPFYTVYDMSTLASYYAGNGQSVKGIELCREGIELAKKSGLSSQLLMMYHALAENYKAAGNTVEYSTALESIIALKDSFNNINSSKLLADMQAASEAQKNEKTIVEQKLKITVKNYWLFGSAVFALMAAAIVWLAFKNYHRKQNIKMQLALAEEKRIAAQSVIDAEEQERKRIAADLHDNIGAYATAICADVEKITSNTAGENGLYLQNLQQHSKEIISSLRDTIWVLNKEYITITGISDRIKNYIFKLRPSYDRIHFHISEDISEDIRFGSQNALNVFRIVQEGLHNALKHSGANDIGISIVSSDRLLIRVSDNGLGIGEITNDGGNGLRNMQARAAESGLQLSIESGTHGGTILQLESDNPNVVLRGTV